MTYLFHATLSDAVPSIAKTGLVPSDKPRPIWGESYRRAAKGKVFFSTTIEDVKRWGHLLVLRTEWEKGPVFVPVLLRVSDDALQCVLGDKAGGSEAVYVEHVVFQKSIQIWVPWTRRWVKISSAVPEFGDLAFDFIRKRPDFNDLLSGYLKSEWPNEEEAQYN